MNIKDYKNPNGKLIDTGKGIHPFVPDRLPPKIEYDDNLIFLLSEADRNFSRLAGLGLNLPNPYILILPYIKKDAVSTSKIEGTQASLTDLFLYELKKRKPKEDTLGLREISNYVVATQRALKILKKRKEISLDLIKFIHRILLRGVRGERRNPGHLRITQNALVPYENCPIDEVIYFPPPPNEVPRLILDLMHFIENGYQIPVLIKVAIIHYQFEAIHPFCDGNGRIGRLLITMYLCERGGMRHPLLYLSAFFEKNRKEYYDRLLKVSQESDWISWIKYFLTAVSTQSLDTIKNVENLLKLRAYYEDVFRKNKVSENVRMLAEGLFLNPFTTANNAAQFLGVTHQTALNTIRTLEKIEILEESTQNRRRNRVYKAVDILKMLEPIDKEYV